MRRALVLLAGCGRIGFATPADSAGDLDVGADTSTDTSSISVGLRASYPMETIANGAIDDATGRGHDGTCTSGTTCPTIVVGRVGNAFLFDGVDDRIDVPPAAELHASSALTVALWLRTTTNPTVYQCAVNKAIGTANDDSWQLCVTPGPMLYFATGGAVSDELFSTSLLPLGSWHFVVLRWDGATKAIVLDGAVVNTSSISALEYDLHPMTFGADINGGTTGSPFAGALDELRVFDRALSMTEIAELMAGP